MSLIHYITRIQFDDGAAALLPAELVEAGIERPMIVTDVGIRESGLLSLALAPLAGRPVQVFDRTPPNPTEAAVRECVRLLKETGCDGLVAVGGGSAIDLAKASALLGRQGGQFADYEVQRGGSPRIREVVPWIAVPTTAGTGAEVGRAAVITLDSGFKAVAVSLRMVPKAVICDPTLTYSLPPRLTAATGIDALTHGIEAYLSTVVNPPAAAIAIDCVRRIACNIRQATHNGADPGARWEMMMGALEGGLVLQKSLGALHAMSTPLGKSGAHHGMLNAVLLPSVLRFNAPAAPEKYADLKRAIGLGPDADLAAWGAELVRDLGLPQTLRELGIAPERLPAVATAAARDHLSPTNPRAVTERDYLELLQQVY